MSDIDVTVRYNQHRLNALKRVLEEQGKEIEPEMYHALDTLYKKSVPAEEQSEIESLIMRETKEPTGQSFAVVHMHENDDDFHFTTELRNSFYNAAYLYSHYLQNDIGKLTLDSLAFQFGCCQPIDEVTFSVLCDTMPNDNRITALLEFDFDNGIISVCDSSDNHWQTYNLKDVSAAVCQSERKSGLTLQTQREIFEVSLQGKEIQLGQTENSEITM